MFWAMGALVLFGVIVGIVWLLYLVASPARRQGAKRAFPPARLDLLRMVCKRIGGEVIDEPGKYKVPFLRATVRDVRLALVLLTTEDAVAGPYIVAVEVPMAGQSFVEAWPLGSPFLPKRVTTGMPELKLGDSSFDGSYLVRADDEAHARSVLTGEVRRALAQMRSLGRGGRVRFDLHPQKAVFQKEEQVEEAGLLGELVGIAVEAATNLKESLTTQAGMEFYDDAPKRVLKAQCPICGVPIEAAKVACRRCGTPHHEECWKYFGACSMFACGEKSYELA